HLGLEVCEVSGALSALLGAVVGPPGARDGTRATQAPRVNVEVTELDTARQDDMSTPLPVRIA
ncbi:hypothetical protein, partial [Microbacterium sp. B24]|uniref:hypothetical protein n=1 Tax=Microbacterium sp. B24 TaxID=95616 RepID=UPI00195547B7